ncbi:MAG: hypothetical protein M1816_004364 [Peltula sp. TS41687]|nr:MAG: hypothetical protein M1816_004364 [Peltula sp. TS41687]
MRRVVQMLRDDPDLELQLSCYISSAVGQSRRVKRGTSSRNYLSIIIYGASHLFEDIGAFLQTCGMFLQDPVGCNRNVVYRNPHRLSGLDPEAPMTLQYATEPVAYSLEIKSNAVEFLAKFESGDTLPETECPMHQMQALTFMLKREQSWILQGPGLDMWSLEQSSLDHTSYVNNVVGCRQYERPPEFRGGIIADHMGLGKSLSMIALIASDWERHIEQHDSLDSISLLERRATLLVVPSTLVQSWEEQLSNLLKFLRVYPYSDPKIFDAHITQLWKAQAGHDAIERLKKLLGFIMLRRSGTTIELPPRQDLVLHLTFSPDERCIYEAARNQTVEALDQELASGSSHQGSYINALQKVNVLRMICNLGGSSRFTKQQRGLPGAMTTPDWTSGSAQEAFNALLTVGEARCSDCSTQLEMRESVDPALFIGRHLRPYLSRCLYLWCGECVPMRGAWSGETSCGHNPSCTRYPVSTTTTSLVTQSALGELGSDVSVQLPTKIKALISDLQNLDETKSIVFSIWTSTLDLVEVALKNLKGSKLSYVRYDGQVSAKKRVEALDLFQKDAAVNVLLLSITCGALGLNLAAASRAYIMEPHWNPTVEEQALARIHRMGQTKEIGRKTSQMFFYRQKAYLARTRFATGFTICDRYCDDNEGSDLGLCWIELLAVLSGPPGALAKKRLFRPSRHIGPLANEFVAKAPAGERKFA